MTIATVTFHKIPNICLQLSVDTHNFKSEKCWETISRLEVIKQPKTGISQIETVLQIVLREVKCRQYGQNCGARNGQNTQCQLQLDIFCLLLELLKLGVTVFLSEQNKISNQTKKVLWI